jgi:hypothetical protein
VRSHIKCDVILDFPSNQTSTKEILWLELQSGQQTYVVACCYHPPKSAYKPSEFSDELAIGLDYALLTYPSAIILIFGDFNMLDTCFLEHDYGLQLVVNCNTHGNKILDKVFLSQPDIYDCKVIKSIVKTKHKAICLLPHSSLAQCPTNRKKLKVYDLRPIFINRLQRAIAFYDWDSLFHLSNPITDIYEEFLMVTHSLIDLHVPSHTVTLGRRDPEYVTPIVKCLLRRRRTLRKKGRFEQADKLAERINKIINKHRETSLSKLAEASPKDLWASVNHKRKDTRITLRNGILLDCDSINQFFANIATDPDYDIERIKAFWNCNCETTASTQEIFINDYEVEPLLRHLKNTSPGVDCLPAWLFNLCSYELASIVARIFNISFLTGQVPNNWLSAVVTPIPKVPLPKHLNDFRPISVTPLLSRLAEKLIVTRWLRPAIPNENITDQFAFKPTGSTTCAIVYSMHHITRLLETNNFVRCLCIDFSKAFDTVRHELLLPKLKKLPLLPSIFNWIISFLTGRSQVCKFYDKCSAPCFITSSIIQGSGIGPTLYIVMESDLHPLSSINVMFKYADDTNLLVPENSDVELIAEYKHVLQWASINGMTINVAKTKEIVFHRPCPIKFHMCSPIDGIERVQQIRLLGVIIQDNFNVEAHVNYILSICSQRIFLMKKLRDQGLPRNQLQIVFQALIISRLLYALPAWGSYLSAALIGRIDAFLKRSFKYGLTTTILNVCELMDSASRVLFDKMQKSGHCLYDILPKRDVININLRPRGHTFQLPHCSYDLFKKSFLNRCLFAYK